MKKLRRANAYWNIPKEKFKKVGIFNPVVGVDNLFFVDPLLLMKTSTPEFKGSLVQVRKYFSDIITLIETENSAARNKAFKKLILREVRGLGIGYGNSSDDGSAIGPELAGRLLATASDLIKMGIKDPEIFEVMGLFEEDFGPDRLSDALIRILLKNFYAYTERITSELGIKDTVTIKTYERSYQLPKHPLKKKPLIFIPNDILRDLPIANSFSEISEVATFNQELREKFNRLIAQCFSGKKKPKKRDIKDFILSSEERIKTLVDAYRSCRPDAYDFNSDPRGLYLWLEKAQEIVKNNPVVLPTNPNSKEVAEIVSKIITAFKKFIETKGGWRSLYDDSKRPLNERHARLLFYATSLLYCESCNIDITPESNAGQGPVDFKLSRGSQDKIVVEVKLTSGNVRQGYLKQTRLYQESEEAKESYYLVVRVTEKSKALEGIQKLAQEEDKEKTDHPTIIVIDGLEKLSASKA